MTSGLSFPLLLMITLFHRPTPWQKNNNGILEASKSDTEISGQTRICTKGEIPCVEPPLLCGLPKREEGGRVGRNMKDRGLGLSLCHVSTALRQSHRGSKQESLALCLTGTTFKCRPHHFLHNTSHLGMQTRRRWDTCADSMKTPGLSRVTESLSEKEEQWGRTDRDSHLRVEMTQMKGYS